MAGYFAGVVAGRTLGSRLARRHDPARLLALAAAGLTLVRTSRQRAMSSPAGSGHVS